MEIELNRPKVTGLKQSVKAILDGRAEKAFLADDADAPIRSEGLECCRKMNVPVEAAGTKASLGKICGIERAAAVAVVLKPQK